MVVQKQVVNCIWFVGYALLIPGLTVIPTRGICIVGGDYPLEQRVGTPMVGGTSDTLAGE